MMAAFALLLAACGSDASGENAGGGFPADTTCGLAITSDLGNITAQTSVACATLLAFDAGFETDYIATEGELRRVDLAVDEVTRGETGNGFPATLTLTDAAQERWEAGCMANVSTHELVSGNDYKIAGTGSCSAPATSQSSATNVTVGDFAFVTVVNWTQ